MSKENFMASAEKIDMIKIRMSYGLLGSDKIDDYQYIAQLNGEGTYVLNGQLVNGTAIGTLPTPGIRWEQSEQLDVGVDMSFYQNRLDVTLDYFNKKTNDLLIPDVPVSGILGTTAPGASSPTINAGTVKNSGIEFSIGGRGGNSEKFSYRINYNFTYLYNEVLAVNNKAEIKILVLLALFNLSDSLIDNINGPIHFRPGNHQRRSQGQHIAFYGFSG